MQYKTLGRTGLLVSELCLGTMTFGGRGELWSKIGSLGQDEAQALIRTALEAGINFSTPPTSIPRDGPKRSPARRSRRWACRATRS